LFVELLPESGSAAVETLTSLSALTVALLPISKLGLVLLPMVDDAGKPGISSGWKERRRGKGSEGNKKKKRICLELRREES
jgi:hypothetical protein